MQKGLGYSRIRYVASQGRHPKWLDVSDVPKILASGALFARKFRPDGVAQEFIDRTVLGLVPDRETALQ